MYTHITYRYMHTSVCTSVPHVRVYRLMAIIISLQTETVKTNNSTIYFHLSNTKQTSSTTIDKTEVQEKLEEQKDLKILFAKIALQKRPCGQIPGLRTSKPQKLGTFKSQPPKLSTEKAT